MRTKKSANNRLNLIFCSVLKYKKHSQHRTQNSSQEKDSQISIRTMHDKIIFPLFHSWTSQKMSNKRSHKRRKKNDKTSSEIEWNSTINWFFVTFQVIRLSVLDPFDFWTKLKIRNFAWAAHETAWSISCSNNNKKIQNCIISLRLMSPESFVHALAVENTKISNFTWDKKTTKINSILLTSRRGRN